MPAARFDHAGGSLIFSRPPERPARELELIQAETRSAGGVPFGFTIYDVEDLLPLRWRGLLESEAVALESFFRSILNGMAEPFLYTDVAGVAHSVRFATPEIDSVERASGRRDISLQLLIL